MSAPRSSVEAVAQVGRRLGPLVDDTAFLGGSVVSLLLSDPAAPPPRVTRDVDLIVEVATRRDYWKLERQLKARGFVQDEEDGIVCRWIVDEIKVDVMPTDAGILGFTARWYAPAIQSARPLMLQDVRIRLVAAPYFVATKLEAFLDRGQSDVWSSHDLQDIIAVVDGRPELIAEIASAPADLRQYVAETLKSFFADPDFEHAVSGHLAPDSASQQRTTLVVDRIRSLTRL